jgi:hypothetical protein
MADTKISGLPASTTPLAGTEVLPIVQSGTTKQVSVANLTAGRDTVINTLTAGLGSGSVATNTAFGYQALLAVTTAANSTAIGYQALKSAITNSTNTAIGYQASALNSTAANTTAVGYQALYNNANNGNVAIGHQAGLSNTFGTIVAIGYQAGYAGSANANTTGTQNMYIGYQAIGSGATNTNEIVIGYTAVGNGSNSTTIGNSSTTLTKLFGVIKGTNYTVATLPSASTSGVGARAFVTDALTPTFGVTVVTGGAVATPVYSDGTNWKVG